jgi:cyclomaltodextrinase
MKIIIDGVFNHVGATFWAFKDVVKNQQNSKYKDWFYIKRWDNPETSQNEFEYQGWYGVKDLPELKEDENGLIPPVKKHIFNIVKRWQDPNGDGDPSDGIDGWRLDVADMVNINFWKEFRTVVKSINPNAYITGEIWWEDWSKNKIFNAAPWLDGTSFDAVMNYRFARAVKRFIADNKLGINAIGFADSLRAQYSDYSWENILVLMNLLDSHDTERLASIVVNPDHFYDHYANPQQNPEWKVRKPNLLESKKQKLMIALQMTLPGAPMIYYGDEAGMWGGDDPDDRKPMVWNELKYSVETHHPFGKKRQADSVKFDENIFSWYKKLISLRKEHPVLATGQINFSEQQNKNLLAFTRTNNNEKLLVIVNKGNKTAKINNTILEQINSEDLILNLNSKNIIEPYSVKIFKLKM